jgi:hypothetical protein
VLIRLALAVIAAVIACNIPHSLIPMFKESLSEATPPPEIQNVLAGKRKIVTVGDSITEAGKYPGGYVWLLATLSECSLSRSQNRNRQRRDLR